MSYFVVIHRRKLIYLTVSFFHFSFHFWCHLQEEANWNSGPNTQFYRMAQYFIDQGDDNTLFFYMEGDLTIDHLYHLQLQTSLYRLLELTNKRNVTSVLFA